MATAEELSNDVALLRDAAAPLQDRVLIIMRLHQAFVEATGAHAIQAFVDAGGVTALADIIATSWPPGAAFEHSDYPADVVLLLTPDLDPKLLGWGPVSGQAARALRGKATVLYRSLRRVALDMLADITDRATGVVAQVLQACGLFGFFSFPNMLSTSMDRYVPGQSSTEQCEHPDQGQQMAERLLWLAATAAARNQAVARFLAQYCAVPVNKAFKDPWQVKWEPQHKSKLAAAATAAAAKVIASVKQRYSISTSRIWPEAMQPGLDKTALKEKLAHLDFFGSQDQLTGTYARFMNIVCKAASEAELLTMVEQGDANSKVIRCIGHPAVGRLGSMHLNQVHAALMAAWDWKALQLSQEMAAARLTGPVARAASLREEGNTRFKAAEYAAALQAYMAALAETPQDARLYLNISLTHLRMGNINEAYDVARSGLAHDPTNSKAWVRLGDACREAGRWQLAALCYSAAKLVGGAQDPDIEARHEQAVGYLDRAWCWDEIPPPWDVAGHAAWLNLQGKPGLNMDAWLKKVQKEISKLTHTSRSIATKLKAHMLTAQAMAAARDGRLARLPTSNEWQMSWGDMPMKAPVTGQVRYMIQVADAAVSTKTDPALTPAPALLEGQPGAANCIQALAMACFHPPNSLPPNKPSSLSLSFRMLADYAALRAVFTDGWGIPVTMETKTDAQRAAVQYDTHYLGRNFEDVGYTREQLFHIASKMDDPFNDHKKTPSPSSSSKPSSSGSNTNQQRGSSIKKKKQQQQQQAGIEAKGATAAATEHQRPSRSRQNDSTAGCALPGGSSIQVRTVEQMQRQQQQQDAGVTAAGGQQRGGAITIEDGFDGMTISLPGGSSSSSSGSVRATHATLTQHCRMTHGADWGSLVKAVRQGRVSGKDVKALQHLVDALK